MKRSRFAEEQIIAILREQEAGVPTAAAGGRQNSGDAQDVLRDQRGHLRLGHSHSRCRYLLASPEPWFARPHSLVCGVFDTFSWAGFYADPD